jgi:hypothetical protein
MPFVVNLYLIFSFLNKYKVTNNTNNCDINRFIYNTIGPKILEKKNKFNKQINDMIIFMLLKNNTFLILITKYEYVSEKLYEIR